MRLITMLGDTAGNARVCFSLKPLLAKTATAAIIGAFFSLPALAGFDAALDNTAFGLTE